MKGIKWKRNGLAILAVMLCAVIAVGMAACGGSSSSGSDSISVPAHTVLSRSQHTHLTFLAGF